MKLKTLLLAFTLLIGVAGASAQLRLGIKAGTLVNKVYLQEKTFDPANRFGYTAGLTLQYAPKGMGFGFDVSAMYAHRVSEGENFSVKYIEEIITSKNFRDRGYVEFPVNLKFRVPVIENVLVLWGHTGPTFAVLASKADIIDGYKNRSCDIAWNFGASAELFKNIQVGVSYGLGMTNLIKETGLSTISYPYKVIGKNNYWAITATYFI